MRYAIISDIHANLEALQAVLDDIDKNKIDEVLCLGDIVGYGANPNECVELVSERCRVCIKGNHDAAALDILSTLQFNINAKIAIEWTVKELKTKNLNFLSALPVHETINDITLVHSTPYEPGMWYYISSLEEAAFNFKHFSTPVCFTGHTHLPMIVEMDSSGDTYLNKKKEVAIENNAGSRILVNVGSVGQPRDRNPKSSYGIFDSEKNHFHYRRVAYDIEKTQAKMRKIKMPEFLINRLSEGR